MRKVRKARKNIFPLIFVFIAALLTAPAVFAAAAPDAETKLKMSAAELKLMNTFLSNFSELLFWNVDAGNIENARLVDFGIRHNYVNNYKSRIAQCKDKNCKYGALVIDGKHVAESVKKYFALSVKLESDMEHNPPYYYDGKLYHFDGADGEAVFYAKTEAAYKRGDGTLRIEGTVYDPDAEDYTSAFEAVAKPYKYGGKDTWSLKKFSLIEEDGGDSDVPDDFDAVMPGVLLVSKSIVPTDPPDVERRARYDGKEEIDGEEYYLVSVLTELEDRYETLGRFAVNPKGDRFYWYDVVGDEYKRIVVGDKTIALEEDLQ